MLPTMPMTAIAYGSGMLCHFLLLCGSCVGISIWLNSLLIRWVTILCGGPLESDKLGTSCKISLICLIPTLVFPLQTFLRAFGIRGLTFKLAMHILSNILIEPCCLIILIFFYRMHILAPIMETIPSTTTFNHALIIFSIQKKYPQPSYYKTHFF